MHAIYSFIFFIVLPFPTLNDTSLCLPFRLVTGNDISCLFFGLSVSGHVIILMRHVVKVSVLPSAKLQPG